MSGGTCAAFASTPADFGMLSIRDISNPDPEIITTVTPGADIRPGFAITPSGKPVVFYFDMTFGVHVVSKSDVGQWTETNLANMNNVFGYGDRISALSICLEPCNQVDEQVLVAWSQQFGSNFINLELGKIDANGLWTVPTPGKATALAGQFNSSPVLVKSNSINYLAEMFVVADGALKHFRISLGSSNQLTVTEDTTIVLPQDAFLESVNAVTVVGPPAGVPVQ